MTGTQPLSAGFNLKGVRLGVLIAAVLLFAAFPALAAADEIDPPPDTTITEGPEEGSTIADKRPRFKFVSDDPAATFECSLNGSEFTACTSPHRLETLPDGAYTFEVRAVDAANQVDETPASRSFNVQTGVIGGVFGCRATVLALGASEFFTANPPGVPCVTDLAALVPPFDAGNLVRLRGVSAARTDANRPDGGVSGKARAADIALLLQNAHPTLPVLRINAVTSRAVVRCNERNRPKIKSESRVAGLRIAGIPIPVGNGPLTLDLGIAQLYLNRTIEGDGFAIQRALEVDFAGDSPLDIKLADARAAYSGNPCNPPL